MNSSCLRSALTFAATLVLSAIALLASSTDRTQSTPRTALDRYVARPDPHYTWHLVNATKSEGYTTYILEMISQSWLTTNEVNRPLWQHWLTLVKPDKVTSATGLLFIGGGSNKSEPPPKADANFVTIATASGTVVTELRNVPNEPLLFAGETQERTEDGIIAYTWNKFLRTGDEKWPARLPMTKAAVRALDTISAFCASDAGGNVTVDKFFVAGGSKRGWTTWTTAAVDHRVVAIVPMVIDMLNSIPSFEHHYRAYGFYSPAVKDYEEMGIMEVGRAPRYLALMRLVE